MKIPFGDRLAGLLERRLQPELRISGHALGWNRRDQPWYLCFCDELDDGQLCTCQIIRTHIRQIIDTSRSKMFGNILIRKIGGVSIEAFGACPGHRCLVPASPLVIKIPRLGSSHSFHQLDYADMKVFELAATAFLAFLLARTAAMVRSRSVSCESVKQKLTMTLRVTTASGS